MHRVVSSFILLATLFAACAMFAQDDPLAASTNCNFDEDKQLIVQYQRIPINLKKPLSLQVPLGKVWAPGGKPMTLFTNGPIQLGSRTLGVGAYTMFVIPTSKQWTLIVSKSTDMSGAYDERQDLVRVLMELGELPSPEEVFSVGFGHIAPGQCSIRMALEKTGHFAIFQKK